MIFQDPYESLNPRMRVADIVAEPLRVHKVATDRADERRRVERALTEAGLSPPDIYWDRHPHQFRVGRDGAWSWPTLALEPQVLVADEPVSMLDVSVRAEILNLLARLASEQGVAVLMITHDLSTVAAYRHRVGVMYLGPGGGNRTHHGGADIAPSPLHRGALVGGAGPGPRPADPSHRARRRDPGPVAHRPPVAVSIPAAPAPFDQCPIIDPPLEVVGADHLAACLLNSR